MSETVTEELSPTLPGLDQLELIRAEVKTLIAVDNRSVKLVAAESSVGYTTLSAFLNGTYIGRNDQVAEKLQVWLDGRKTARRMRAVMPRAPGFLQTETSTSLMAVLEHAQHAPDLVVATGGAGVGKTMTCQEYAVRSPNVWIVTCEPCFCSVRDVLEATSVVLSLPREFRTMHFSASISSRLKNSRGLLIYDEANHLTSEALDQLRTIHDVAHVGIALVGNETIISRVEGDGRKAHFAQLYRRVGMRLSRSGARSADIDVILTAWQIVVEKDRKMLRAIARKPGALGNITKTLRLAFMQSGAAGRDMPNTADIASAWHRISNTAVPEDVA